MKIMKKASEKFCIDVVSGGEKNPSGRESVVRTWQNFQSKFNDKINLCS